MTAFRITGNQYWKIFAKWNGPAKGDLSIAAYCNDPNLPTDYYLFVPKDQMRRVATRKELRELQRMRLCTRGEVCNFVLDYLNENHLRPHTCSEIYDAYHTSVRYAGDYFAISRALKRLYDRGEIGRNDSQRPYTYWILYKVVSQ